jgi:transcription antitermination factor NusG
MTFWDRDSGSYARNELVQDRVAMQSHFNQTNWFAIQVKPKHERTAAKVIRQKGFQELVPTYWCRRKWSDREKDIEFPLFPGYVFCRFDPEIRVPILSTPGVRRVVGGVEAHEITALQRLVNSGQDPQPWPYLNSGAKVRVKAGPLTGVEGIMVSAKGVRLVISVTLLQRSVAVELDPRWVGEA